jgi:hypothetical protein
MICLMVGCEYMALPTNVFCDVHKDSVIYFPEQLKGNKNETDKSE